MTQKMWFGPLPPPAATWDMPIPANDGHFEQLITNMAGLLSCDYDALEIRCEDASRLTASALNALTGPLLEKPSKCLQCLGFWKYTSLNASTFALLAQQTPNLRTIEVLEGPRLDAASVGELAHLPHLEELAVDDLAPSPECSREQLLLQLAACKSLRRLAIPRCFLREHEIALVITACGLTELAIANAFDEDGQQGIQEKHPDCTIHWGYLI